MCSDTEQKGHGMTESLFKQPRRKTGATEALLAKTLRAWHEQGLLQGDEWATARGILRDAARAVDAARAGMYSGEVSPYSFSRTNELYRQAMVSFQEPEREVKSDGDDLDAFLASLTSSSGPRNGA